MTPIEKQAWEIYCQETAGDLDVRDFWEELSPRVQQNYLQKVRERIQTKRREKTSFRTTKPGVAICPFFCWQSENIGDPDKSPKEDDVNLTYCTHPDNPDRCEGNCQEKLCPLV